MRLLLVLLLIGYSVHGYSQTYKWHKPDLAPKYPLYRYDRQHFLIPFSDSLPTFQNLVAQLPNRSGVVFLPQDNMPCLVPPPPSAGLIPNFWRPQYRGSMGFMPNPAQPFRLNELFLEKNGLSRF